MTYLLSEFKPWAIRHGIALIRDDILFLESRVGHLPRIQLRNVLKGYIAEWRAGMEECESDLKKDNAGRFRANTWLRENFTSAKY